MTMTMILYGCLGCYYINDLYSLYSNPLLDVVDVRAYNIS